MAQFVQELPDSVVVAKVKAPVVLSYRIGVVALRDVVVIFAEKVAKSAAARKPGWLAVAVAMVQVSVPPEAEMERPELPEVANV